MLQTAKAVMAQEKTKYRIPRSVQDLIPVQTVWKDGIFKCGKMYTKSYKFTDINYRLASSGGQDEIFEKYSKILNSRDSNAVTKITVSAHNYVSDDRALMIPLKGDKTDEYREECNHIFTERPAGKKCMRFDRYITVSAAQECYEDARVFFDGIEPDLVAYFAAMGSKCTPMDATERLKVLHDFYRTGDEDDFHFDMKELMRKGHSFKDVICPDSFERFDDHMKLSERYARVLYLKDYAAFIDDRLVAQLTDIGSNAMLSVDFIPVPMDEAAREVEKILLNVDTNITRWQRKQNQNNNWSATIPFDMEQQRQEANEFMRDLTGRDQRMMLAVVTLLITADSKAELEHLTNRVKSIARQNMCQLAVLKWQQVDGMNTALPIGVLKLDCFRTLTTESLAVFTPFRVQEIRDPNGIYFGDNAISHNRIMIDQSRLMNQAAFILGVSGSGKSMFVKWLILMQILLSDDDILIYDPEGEFATMIEAMRLDAAIVRVAAGGKDRLNAMCMLDGYGEGDPTVVKSEFILSLLEQIDKQRIGAEQKSIIDRCVEMVVREAQENGCEATLTELREKLMEQPEKEARKIALMLELYTTGSLDIFGQSSNVDLDKRIVVFDTHNLSSQLKSTGLLMITDTMMNRVAANWKKNKRTHIFIDEYHTVFENEYSARFFNSAWRQFRKRNAYPTAITQNVEFILHFVEARTMLSNSELVVMFNQSPSDAEALAGLYNISPEQLRYIHDAEPGCGLVKYGSTIIPFENRIPKGTKIYDLMTTKPGEGIFGKQKSK